MAILKYQGREARSREGETVLDAFLRQGITVPFSCRNGTCHVCLQQCVQGAIPPVAQNGLSPELRERNYFKTCKCVPLGDMEIAPPEALYSTTLVYGKEMLSPYVCKLLLEPPSSLDYRAGQFVNLRRRGDGLTRSYSLASLPGEDYFLEIHVLRKTGGEMSNWICDTLQAGDEIDLQGPAGDCYYRAEERSHPMLMLATGTGLAPLYGILRDALQNRHKGEIHLYHGGRDEDRFYLRGPLRELEKAHPHFRYHECVSGTRTPPHGAHAGRVHEVAFARHANLRGWHVHIAGLAEMVEAAEQLAVQHGAAPERIYSDAFALRDLRKTPRDGSKPEPTAVEMANGRPKYPPPDPELWAALGQGELLHKVLSDFYTKVYQDERLASFFEGVTKQRLIEKQFLFMRQILTGEKIYFGDQPRNTHHWMVISEDLFDYRAEMMKDSLRKFGLPEDMVERFHAIEDYYRRDVVKDAPFPKKIGDTEMPLEGFDELVLDVGSLCDVCQREVKAGEKVIYHVRLGKIYCSDCSEPHNHEVPA